MNKVVKSQLSEYRSKNKELRLIKPTTLILFLIMSLLLVACSEESPSTGANSTQVAGLARLNLAECAASVPTVANSATSDSGGKAVPVPTGFRIFVSNVYPYALAHPESWTVRDNQVAGNLKSDLIVAERTDKTTGFMYVLSEKLDNATTDSKTYFDGKLKELNATQKGLVFEQQGERQVAGSTAYVLSFNAGQPYLVQQLQITFVAQGRGWVVSYSATPDVSKKYCGQFSQILDTFTLTNLSK
jgi:hypothetical protein